MALQELFSVHGAEVMESRPAELDLFMLHILRISYEMKTIILYNLQSYKTLRRG